MRIIRTDKQKDNLAKFFWDMGKVTLVALVIAPFAKPETVEATSIITGVLVSMAFVGLGYWLDGREVGL